MAKKKNRTERDQPEPQHDGPVGSGRYSSDKEVRSEFEEAQRFAAGGEQLQRKMSAHTDNSPKLTAGDVDAAWDEADTSEEVVGGTNPTPDQDVVDEIGEAVGLTYEDVEPLRPEEKLISRDERRWELEPRSAEDYQERVQEEKTEKPKRGRSR